MNKTDIGLKTVEQSVLATIYWVNEGDLRYDPPRSLVLGALACRVLSTGKTASVEVENPSWDFSIIEYVSPSSFIPTDAPDVAQLITTCEIRFAGGFRLYLVPGGARDIMLKIKGTSNLDIGEWFDTAINDAAKRTVWLPVNYSGSGPAENIAIDDLTAQAAWCIVNSGHAKKDLGEFLRGFAFSRVYAKTKDKLTSEGALGELFVGYKGHQSPLSMLSYLRRLTSRVVDTNDVPPTGDLLENLENPEEEPRDIYSGDKSYQVGPPEHRDEKYSRMEMEDGKGPALYDLVGVGEYGYYSGSMEDHPNLETVDTLERANLVTDIEEVCAIGGLKSSWRVTDISEFGTAPAITRIPGTKHRKAKVRIPEGVLLSTHEVAKFIRVNKRTLYLAIKAEDGVDCETFPGQPRKRSTPWGNIESNTGNRYLFNGAQVLAAKKYFDEKERRKILTAAYAERRGASNATAARWVKRKEQENSEASIEDIALLLMETTTRKVEDTQKAEDKPLHKVLKPVYDREWENHDSPGFYLSTYLRSTKSDDYWGWRPGRDRPKDRNLKCKTTHCGHTICRLGTFCRGRTNVSIVAESGKGVKRGRPSGYLPEPKDNGPCQCGRWTTKHNDEGWFCYTCEFEAMHA